MPSELYLAIANFRSFLQSCARSIIQALAYVLHTEALDALDDHFGNCPQFSNVSKSNWEAKLTLIYWTLKIRPEDDYPRNHHSGHSLMFWRKPASSSIGTQPRDAENGLSSAEADDNFDEGRGKSAQFPPDYLGQKRVPRLQPAQFSLAKHHIEEKATTICLSTNTLGDLGKCTVISRIISEDDMVEFSRKSVDIWNAFIHQPQTTRCILFLLLVGYTCESLAQKYREILEVLKDELGLNVRHVPRMVLHLD
jgi:hypothetical protein